MKIWVAICLSFVASVLPLTGSHAARQIARMAWDIDPLQFAGTPLRGRANILFLDENNELVDSIQLGTLGLQLELIEFGDITHTRLDSPLVIAGGVLDLTERNIRINSATAITGRRGLRAISNLGQVETTLDLNGLQFESLAGPRFGRRDRIYLDIPYQISFAMRNYGSLGLPESFVFTATFLSGRGSVRSFITTDTNELTRSVTLPFSGSSLGPDSIMVDFETEFNGDSVVISEVYPVDFLPPANLRLTLDEAALLLYRGTTRELTVSEVGASLPDTFNRGAFEFRFVSADTEIVTDQFYLSANAGTARQNDLRVLQSTPKIWPTGQFTLGVSGHVQADGAWLSIQQDSIGVVQIADIPELSLILPTSFPTSLVAGEVRRFPFSIVNPFADSLPLTRPFVDLEFVNYQIGVVATARALVLTQKLAPSVTSLLTEPTMIPTNAQGYNVVVRTSIGALVPNVEGPVSFVDSSASPITIAAPATLQIVSLNATAPNAPFVNTGQAFQLRCGIANLSSSPVTNARLRLSSEGGGSIFDSSLIVANLPANDTTFVVLDVIAAAQSTPSEVFRVDIIEPADISLPPIDNTAPLVISRPPSITITPGLPGVTGGIVTLGSEFALVLDIRNDGEGSVVDTRFEISTSIDFEGVANPFIGDLVVGQSLTLAFLAPDQPTSADISFRFLSPPRDVNTGLPAEVFNSSFTLSLDVAASREPLLFVTGEEENGNLYQSGAEQRLVSFQFVNEGAVSLGPISLKTLDISLLDADGTPLNPSTVFVPGTLRFLDGATEIGTALVQQHRIQGSFPSFLIDTAGERTCTFSAQLSATLPGEFYLRVSSEDIDARLAQGPFIDPINIRAPSGDSVLNERFFQGGESFASSLRVKTNPFNPQVEPAEFRFLPSSGGAITFTVQTLVGEIVYQRILSSADLANASPYVSLNWDGRSEGGEYVRNGVYVVSIFDDSSGELAKLRVAVFK